MSGRCRFLHRRRRCEPLIAAAIVTAAALALTDSWPTAFGPAAPPKKKRGPKPEAAGSAPVQAQGDLVPLLGAGTNWRLTEWRITTDSVKGGKSRAELKGTTEGVDFCGRLDPAETRSGDGFAGVFYRASDLPRKVSEGMKGLCLDVAACDGREYSLQLGVRGSGVKHCIKFRPEKPGRVELPFRGFSDRTNLDLQKVETLTLQVDGGATSSGDKQEEGLFSLGLKTVYGWLGEPELKDIISVAEGRWKCKACGCTNAPEVDGCVRCGAFKNVEELRAQEAAEAARKAGPSTKWTCGCGAKNFANADSCYKCDAPKP
eukprot:TRINITY_DN90846_c0_g1_i1.p1 TRINITY_DN90846_c0_g1~~TRINITY_DN90846_c0_g1_i1.p1  ORF type:complete len:317 (-),score=59.58 TRINITY_DN90846_c0_g1_i1:175-1125(-)